MYLNKEMYKSALEKSKNIEYFYEPLIDAAGIKNFLS